MAIDSTTVILILTNAFSLLANIMQYCYKSKCNKIDLCCGFIHIDRNIQAEQDIESGVNYHNQDNYYYPNISNKERFKKYGTNPLSTKTRRKIMSSRRRSKSF
jgi:hypothetical protein